MLVYGPGHYRFTDFFRLGTPLTVVSLLLLTLAVPFVWPFEDEPAGSSDSQTTVTRVKAPLLPELEVLEEPARP